MHGQVDREVAASPIDMEGGTSAKQYETWTPIGRDRALENDIRRALEERLLGPES